MSEGSTSSKKTKHRVGEGGEGKRTKGASRSTFIVRNAAS